ncbi:hypothetical protein [Micrococcus endophyticus]|uniref:hypothetical protein n=1 Tax=Micrococcus endophyticus TaxID=455343 RepID=UPI0034CDD191
MAAAPFAAASPARFTVDFTAGRAVTSVPGGPSIAVGVGSTGSVVRAGGSSDLTGTQTVTITFGQEVRDVTFTVAGLTRVNNSGINGLLEQVTVAPAPGVASRSGAVGAATAASPLQASAEGQEGSALVTMAGPLRSLTITLSSAQGRAVPRVTITGMSFIAEAGTAAP